MKGMISVATGEVWATAKRIVLRSDGIGSCVVVAAYDKGSRVGALAHVMLPGKSSKSGFGYNTKYARDAIDGMLFKMTRLGAGAGSLEACIVGGANVLQDSDDTLSVNLVNFVIGNLQEKGIRIVARAVGGTTGRSVMFDIEEGAVYCAQGEGSATLLHTWEPCHG